ncbi:hypothetical protein PG985_012756 [Apiospora marii]|uniref:uncharacterized protein n=1 Tax=Apiospora marii TaxID=335849 RepID=UPI003130D3C9
MVDKSDEGSPSGKPSNDATNDDIDNEMILMTIMEFNLEKDAKHDFKVKNWKGIAEKIGLSQATVKTRSERAIPPENNQDGQEAEEKEAEDQEGEMSSTSTGSTESQVSRRATKMRAIPIPAVTQTPALTQRQYGTKRGLAESEDEAESHEDDVRPTRKAPKRGRAAGRPKPQADQGAKKKKPTSTKTTGANNTHEPEAATMPQNSQHSTHTRRTLRSHHSGSSALAGQLSQGSVWPWFHEERRRQEARQRDEATRRGWGGSAKGNEQLDDDELNQDE